MAQAPIDSSTVNQVRKAHRATKRAQNANRAAGKELAILAEKLESDLGRYGIKLEFDDPTAQQGEGEQR